MNEYPLFREKVKTQARLESWPARTPKPGSASGTGPCLPGSTFFAVTGGGAVLGAFHIVALLTHTLTLRDMSPPPPFYK